MRAHQRLGFRRDGKAEPRRESRDAQHPQRILGERRAHMTQHARAQVGFASVRVDQSAVGIARHRIDGQVPTRQVGLQRHVRRGMEGEPVVARTALAFGARERVFLVGGRMQEHRKVAADRAKALGEHGFGRGADDDKVAIGYRAPEQPVAHRAPDGVDLHRRNGRSA